MSDAQTSPSAERNKQPILQALQTLLPSSGYALEIASGTGQHAAWFAAGLPQWRWQPSDATNTSFASIAAWTLEMQLANVLAPMQLDVTVQPWFAAASNPRFDLIYCANMLHIAPWACCQALMQGAAAYLQTGGSLVTYGPYLEDSVETSAGNLAFDQRLRSENSNWGIRRREEVELVAANAGLTLTQRVAMPANNLLLVWKPSNRLPI